MSDQATPSRVVRDPALASVLAAIQHARAELDQAEKVLRELDKERSK